MDKKAVIEKLKDAAVGGAAMPLKLLPVWVEAIGAGVFVSTVVEANPRFKEKLKGLEGKVFLFEARDIGKSFYLLIKEREIKALPNFAGPPDVTMRGEYRTLVDVLLGKTDPDTVFFSRALEISGDTAAAIYFKNILATLG